jgi:hypothetical protein
MTVQREHDLSQDVSGVMDLARDDGDKAGSPSVLKLLRAAIVAALIATAAWLLASYAVDWLGLLFRK